MDIATWRQRRHATAQDRRVRQRGDGSVRLRLRRRRTREHRRRDRRWPRVQVGEMQSSEISATVRYLLLSKKREVEPRLRLMEFLLFKYLLFTEKQTLRRRTATRGCGCRRWTWNSSKWNDFLILVWKWIESEVLYGSTKRVMYKYFIIIITFDYLSVDLPFHRQGLLSDINLKLHLLKLLRSVNVKTVAGCMPGIEAFITVFFSRIFFCSKAWGKWFIVVAA